MKITYDITQMGNLKDDIQINLFTKQKQTQNRLVAKGLGGWEMNGLQVRG